MRKKFLFVIKLLVVLMFVTLLIPFSSASARAGGHTSKSHSSTRSSRSSFFNRRYYGRRYRYSSTSIFTIVLASTIIIIVCNWQKIRDSLPSKRTYLQLSSKNKKAVKEITALSNVDYSWNLNNLEFYVKQAFFAIQDGWTKRDINLCKNYLAPNLLREYEYKIKNMIYAHEINVLMDINLLKCIPIDVHADNINKKYYISFFIKASLVDYIASDINGTLVRGNTGKTSFSEIWIFTLTEEKIWKLCEIQQI